MIPIRLRLRNFLSYGEEIDPLDFTAIKLACLSGRNGHGKSALLDAVCWALWGEARKAGYSRTPDADLLRQGAEEMAVEFTFSLEGREYQVAREFVQRKRSTSKLEFRARADGGDDYIVLTENNKSKTQQRIIDTLGLDYKTFVNSSFLKQGRADEFTRQSPKDRKEILSKILGLDYYAKLLEEARQRLIAARAERKALEEALENIEEELAREADIQTQENELKTQLQEKERSLDTVREERKTIQQQIAQLQLIHDRTQREFEEEKTILKQIEDFDSREKVLLTEKRQAVDLTDREEEIHLAHQRCEAVGAELKDLIETERNYKVLEEQKKDLETRIESQKSEIRVRLTALQTEREHLERDMEECRTLLGRKEVIERDYALFQETAGERKHLEALRPKYDKLQTSLLDVEKQIEHERQAISERIAELRGSTKDLDTIRGKIEDAKKQFTRLPALEDEHKRLQRELDEIVEEGNANNTSMDVDKDGIKRCRISVLDLQERQALLLKGDTQACPLCGQDLDCSGHQEIEKRLQTDIETAERDSKRLEKQVEEKEKSRQTLGQRYKDRKPQLETVEKERNELQHQQKQFGELEDEYRRLQIMQKELEDLLQKLDQGIFATENKKQAEIFQQRLKDLGYDPDRHAEVTQSLQDQQIFQTEWNRLQETGKKLEEKQKRTDELVPDIERLTLQLETSDFAQPERDRLVTLLSEMKPLEKELARRKALQDEQEQLKNAPAEWQNLCRAKERLPEIENELGRIGDGKVQSQKRLNRILEDRRDAKPALRELEENRNKLERKESQRKELEYVRNQLQMSLGGVVEKLKKRRDERKTKRERLTDVICDERHYDILRKAFSRDGIPAMIVDESLPELQHDANRLLSRLTDGRCSVAFESQREKKSGGFGETLDIKIGDEIGTRDYEMFSGGEAFRADLAIRIALSQLLCRRAGSKLQLLVIDEGFGTQDSEGLGLIVDAINEIQDEFEKVLVVTHLDELKDQFMTRIEVTKEPGIGSRFDVVHTGC